MKIPPRIRKLLEKRLEGVRLHLVAGPDCGGWSDIPNARQRKDEMIAEREELEEFLNRSKP
jgi:hypothetical protein